MEAGKTKRIRRDPETTRELILDTTERVMIEDGYAAVGSRRIAQELGLNASTVHYYYPTMDDVFVALHQRMTERQSQSLERVLTSPEPVRAFWEAQCAWDQTALGVEFAALSNHRKTIGKRLASLTDGSREAQARALDQVIASLPTAAPGLSPVALATILVAVGRLLANEERVGITRGHDDVRTFVEWVLGRLAAGAASTPA